MHKWKKKSGKYKKWTLRENDHKMVLGRYLGLEHVVGMPLMDLVCKFSYREMNRNEIACWVEEMWKPLFGYCPKISILFRGWYGFTFKKEEHELFFLRVTWIKCHGILMIEIWHFCFERCTENIEFRHIWVLLPGLPLVFWNKVAMEAIGNHIGHFLHLEDGMLYGIDKTMG